jgi:hypothetical protein
MLIQIFHDYWVEHSLVIDVHLKTLNEKGAPWNGLSDGAKRYAIEVTYFSTPNKNTRTLVRNFPEPEDYQTIVKQLRKIANKINNIKKKELAAAVVQLSEEK